MRANRSLFFIYVLLNSNKSLIFLKMSICTEHPYYKIKNMLPRLLNVKFGKVRSN